ncbi:MAG TPA: L-tyrosine/L-tryptophan isonitrile synthase family protein [Gemmataceae bacterium]|jgi:hypothetical protein
MNPFVSLDLPDAMLLRRAQETVRRHWVRPRAAEPLDPGSLSSSCLPAEHIEKLARTALDTLLTRQFRVGPLPSTEMYEQFLAPVRRFVRKGKPIRILVGYGPLKNPNAVSYSRADWAEFFALCHLVAWHNKLQAVYPPGLEIQIVFDDETLLLANGSDRRLMDEYISSIADLIRLLGFQTIFLPPARLTHNAWFLRFGPYQLFRACLLGIAEWRVRRWERDPANQEKMAQMVEFARRNVIVPAHQSAEEQERFVRAASHRYRVCWDALRLGAQLFPNRERLLALYLDGSQHHRQQVALHLTSVDKGQMTQPWQGEGVLLDNGHQKLEPFVLTAARRSRCRERILEGFDLVARPGFNSIKIVCPQEYIVPSANRTASTNGSTM